MAKSSMSHRLHMVDLRPHLEEMFSCGAASLNFSIKSTQTEV